MTKIFLILTLSILSLISCKKDNNPDAKFVESTISLATHKLAAFSISNTSKYLVVFESGLGDEHGVWNQKNVASQISKVADVLLYDRAGYGKSEKGPGPRNIDKLSSELASVIIASANGRKVILVGHSLGGMIVRDYAIKNPDKVAAILFVDPSHEAYNQPTQTIEDMIYDTFNSEYGAGYGGTMESRELIEDSGYMETLPDLPNVPVIVLSSMKTDADHTHADRQLWYNAHELLKSGVSDFKHISTTISGHYIMVEDPDLVVTNTITLLSKLP
jgi:pimeloyl-ACP methyl ester carboxylesterase